MKSKIVYTLSLALFILCFMCLGVSPAQAYNCDCNCSYCQRHPDHSDRCIVNDDCNCSNNNYNSYNYSSTTKVPHAIEIGSNSYSSSSDSTVLRGGTLMKSGSALYEKNIYGEWSMLASSYYDLEITDRWIGLINGSGQLVATDDSYSSPTIRDSGEFDEWAVSSSFLFIRDGSNIYYKYRSSDSWILLVSNVEPGITVDGDNIYYKSRNQWSNNSSNYYHNYRSRSHRYDN